MGTVRFRELGSLKKNGQGGVLRYVKYRVHLEGETQLNWVSPFVGE